MKKLIYLMALFVLFISTVVIQAKDIEITFWHHYNSSSPENKTLYNVLIPEFEKSNPGIKVKAVTMPWADLHKKILISASSGDQLPDLARSDIIWVPQFSNLNILAALDKEFSDFNDIADHLLESPMSTALVNDSYYGLALNTNTKVLMWNRKVFAENNITEPPATVDEFFSLARELSDARKLRWGYGEPGTYGWNILPWIWSMGGDVLSPDFTRASGYLNSKDTINAISKLADLYKDKGMEGFLPGALPTSDGFAKGNYAMIVGGPWQFPQLEGKYDGFKIQSALFPSGKAGSVQVLGGEDIVMFKTALAYPQKKAAAWKFIKFMTGEFAQQKMLEVGQIPVNKQVASSEMVKESRYMEIFLDQIKTAKARPPIPEWTQVDDILSNYVMLVMVGKLTAEDAMNRASSEIDSLLAK